MSRRNAGLALTQSVRVHQHRPGLPPDGARDAFPATLDQLGDSFPVGTLEN